MLGATALPDAVYAPFWTAHPVWSGTHPSARPLSKLAVIRTPLLLLMVNETVLEEALLFEGSYALAVTEWPPFDLRALFQEH